jgi:hypothetical protein
MVSFLKCLMHAGVCRALRNYGTSQPDREFQPRRIKLEAMVLPTVPAIDRLCATGLLTSELVAESVRLRDDIQAAPKPFSDRAPRPRISSWDRRREPAQGKPCVVPSTPAISWGMSAPCKVLYAQAS